MGGGRKGGGSYTSGGIVGSINKRSIKIGTLSNVGTFPFVYSSVSRTYIISNVNIDIAMVTMVVGPIPMKTLTHLFPPLR